MHNTQQVVDNSEPKVKIARTFEIEKQAYVRRAQNLMHRQLGDFLGFWPWRSGWRIPAHHSIDPLVALDRELARFEDYRGEELSTFRTRLNQIAGDVSPGKIASYQAAEILCAFYGDFQAIANLPAQTQKVKPACTVFDPANYISEQRTHLRPLAALRQALETNRALFWGAYLFGSYATHDFIPGWSDADVLLVLSPACFSDPAVLLKVRQQILQWQKHLFQIDPLQLHGFFIITWADLHWYPEYFFPLILFDYAYSLLEGDETAIITCRNDRAERLDTFRQQTEHIIRVHTSGNLPKTQKEAKLLFHKAFTLPLYFLQAQGIRCYKRESFALARQSAPELNWRCLDEPTRWMRTCANHTRLEYAIRQLTGFNPYAGAHLLQSRPYQWLNRVGNPLWDVHPDKMRHFIANVATLASASMEYILG